MTPAEIVTIVYYSAAALVTITTIVLTIIKLHKAKKQVKTSEEAVKIEKEMELKAVELIGEAEAYYKKLDEILKRNTGESAGPYKKESVMTKLQQYANALNATFDANFWSEKIDTLVKLTKEVNSK